MQTLKRFMFLFFAAFLSVASSSFAFSSNNSHSDNSKSTVLKVKDNQDSLHFETNHALENNLLDAIVDFEEEENEGKKKFSAFFVGISFHECTLVVEDTYQKEWIGHQNQCLQPKSIRLHLLIRKIQV